MRYIGAAALSLVALLYQPVEAQKQVASPTRQAQQQEQKDIEFRDLFRRASELEKKLEKEPHEPKLKLLIRGLGALAIPNDISNRVWEVMHERLTKFTSGYGFTFNKDTTSVFTFDDYLVIHDFEWANSYSREQSRYVIFKEFSAIDSKRQGDNMENSHYSYETFRSIPGNSGFKIIRYPEIVDSFIPLLKSGDFYGISQLARELNFYLNRFNEAKRKKLNYDFKKHEFLSQQLSNISLMLLRNIEDNPDIEDATNPKIDMIIPLPRVAPRAPRVAERIILSGRAYRDFPYRNGYMTLSIAPNGSVDYFFQHTYGLTGDVTPVYKNLKIKFPIIP